MAGSCAYMFSPVFRCLTVQFKVYVSSVLQTLPFLIMPRFLQLAPMVMGGMIEADRRMVAHELLVRQRKRIEKDRTWKQDYEKQLEEVDDETLEAAIREAEFRSRRRSGRTIDR